MIAERPLSMAGVEYAQMPLRGEIREDGDFWIQSLVKPYLPWFKHSIISDRDQQEQFMAA